MKTKLGLIGLVEEEAQKDYWRTLRRVAEIGYQGIESPMQLLEGDVAENMARFKALGLEAAAVGVGKQELCDQIDVVIEKAHTLQTRNVIVYWGPTQSKEQLLQDAAIYDEAGARLRDAGLRLCYHNHEHEFKTRFNGLYALDILAEHTDPSNLFFEVDIAWATFGGEDPVRVLNRLAGRVPVIHVKDLWSLHERDLFTAVGTGVVKIREALQMAVQIGVEWAVIEQDRLRNLTAMETITLSYLYIKELGILG